MSSAAHISGAARPSRRNQTEPTLAGMSAAGLRAFFKIVDAWDLSTDEQIVLLGSPGRSTFFKWKAEPETARLGRDTLERLSLLLGIYKSLQILLPQPAAADAWIKRPNSAPPFALISSPIRMLRNRLSPGSVMP